MDEASTRAIIDAHAAAVVDPLDVAQIQADLIEDLHPQIPAIAALLPQPVREASVDRLDVAADHAIAELTYRGDAASITIRSRWEDRGAGRPQMVEAAPLGAPAG